MSNQSVYEVIQIDGTSYRIEDKTVRCYLFIGREKALLLDTGYGTGNLRELVETITKLPVMLVNTHGDPDHVGANHLFDEAFMHPAEFASFHKRFGKGLNAKALWEGETIDLGNRKLEVILIPGHTPGSIALLDRENRFIITGDSISTTPIYMFGPYRDPFAYIESVRRLDAIKENFDFVYSMHGSFPLEGVVFTDFIEGMQKALVGEIEGTAPHREGVEAKLYDSGKAKFLLSFT